MKSGVSTNIDRRLFLKSTALSCLNFAISVGCMRQSRIPSINKKPFNVLFILSDDQGYGQLGCYRQLFDRDNIHNVTLEERKRWGYSLEKALYAAENCTPNIDKLADEGIRMLNAHAGPSCVPSRAAFLTGRYPQRYGIYNNGDIYVNGLPDRAFSLVKLLQSSGYKTGLVGKWHLGQRKTGEINNGREKMAFCKGKHPLDQGFDFFYGFDGAQTSYYDSPHIWRNREFGIKTGGYLTDHFTEESIGFIENSHNQEKPFFLFLSYNAPHNPISKPPEKYCKFSFDTGNEWLDHFYNTIYAMDCGIGKIIRYLKQVDIEKDTLIIFASDNGASWNFPVPANGPLRGYKRQFYEGGQRIPMLLRQPGHIKSKQDCKMPVSIMDVLPTALEIADADLPKVLEIDGVSLCNLIYGKNSFPENRAFYWAGPMGTSSTKEHRANVKKARQKGVSVWDFNPPGWFVLQGKWKLIDPGDGKIRLYNLDNDINESMDIASKYPDLVRKLKLKYINWRKNLSRPKYWDYDMWEQTLP
jgi:uncharacterized sulfatase